MMTDSILGFNGEHRWLSNFIPVEVEMDWHRFPSVENAYQAAKSDKGMYPFFQTCNASEAKQAGKKVKVRGDWDEVKEQIMEHLLRQKFQQEPFRSQLLDTGDCYIEETNWWKDTFWGVCNGVGDNRLRKLIMKIRNELRNENDSN